MALIKNAIVSMDWEAESFYESKSEGVFIAALHNYETDYGTVPIIFINNIACILWDPDYCRPVNQEEFTELLHDLVEKYGSDINFEEIEETAEAYIEVSNGVTVDEDVISEYSLSEVIQEDIIKRIDDLSGYYVTDIQDL